MALSDLVITAAQVLPGTDADIYQGVAGETITAGQAVYLSNSDHRMRKASATGGTTGALVKGIALHLTTASQPLRVQVAGTITLGAGAAPAVGQIYVLSDTAGAFCESADLASPMRATVLGVGGPSNTVILGILSSGQVAPV